MIQCQMQLTTFKCACIKYSLQEHSNMTIWMWSSESWLDIDETMLILAWARFEVKLHPREWEESPSNQLKYKTCIVPYHLNFSHFTSNQIDDEYTSIVSSTFCAFVFCQSYKRYDMIKISWRLFFQNNVNKQSISSIFDMHPWVTSSLTDFLTQITKCILQEKIRLHKTSTWWQGMHNTCIVLL